MSSKRIKLEPCPFCGGEAKRDGCAYARISCKKCGASTRHYVRMSDATRAWNKRTCKKACKK